MTTMTASQAPVQLRDKTEISRSLWHNAVRYILRDRLTMLGLIGLVLVTAACVFGPPVLETQFNLDANRTNLRERYSPPDMNHLLGTDSAGRDQLLRLLYGGRISLAIAYSASTLSILIGVTLGLMAGYYGGRVDTGLLWFIATLESVPSIFLLLVASTLFSPSPAVLVLILSFLGWVGTCRLVRAEVYALKERDYVLAAHALGAPEWRVMFSHLLPNVLPLIIIALTTSAGVLILAESGLSFLGLGVQPPTPTWGNMLADARSFFSRGTYLVVWPGMLIAVTVLCFYLVGDGLRDALDPRTSKK